MRHSSLLERLAICLQNFLKPSAVVKQVPRKYLGNFEKRQSWTDGVGGQNAWDSACIWWYSGSARSNLGLFGYKGMHYWVWWRERERELLFEIEIEADCWWKRLGEKHKNTAKLFAWQVETSRIRKGNERWLLPCKVNRQALNVFFIVNGDVRLERGKGLSEVWTSIKFLIRAMFLK